MAEKKKQQIPIPR